MSYINTDHKLVTLKLNLKRYYQIRSKIQNQSIIFKKKFDTSKLIYDSEILTNYQNKVYDLLLENNVENWEQHADIMIQAASKTIPTILPNKSWDFFQDDQITFLSEQQKQLLCRINSSHLLDSKKRRLKIQRNKYLNLIHNRLKYLRHTKIDSLIADMENNKDNSRMYIAAKQLFNNSAEQIQLKDSNNRYVNNVKLKATILNSYYSNIFYNQSFTEISPFRGLPKPLNNEVSIIEIEYNIKKLKNGKSFGNDNIPGEFLKYSHPIQFQHIAELINRLFSTHNSSILPLGQGLLIPIKKPGKPNGFASSTRPIILLRTIRKLFSLIILQRIQPNLDKFLSSSQSGFRYKRSTADIIWSHRWMIARVKKYYDSFHILGIDLSKAFDTIDRSKLIQTLENILNEDELRMIQYLISNTSYSIKIDSYSHSFFKTNIGSPQGDSLSPILFIIYLQAVLNDLDDELEKRKIKDYALKSHHIPISFNDLIYADDIDFPNRDPFYLELVLLVAKEVFSKWNLSINVTKTTRSKIDIDFNDWKKEKKLGSLLDSSEDIDRRIQLSNFAIKQLQNKWMYSNKLSIKLRMKLYKCYILPILTYNMGTWSLNSSLEKKINIAHRKQLKKILNINWSHKINNFKLYEICDSKPISDLARSARWRLFGHILRLSNDTPAFLAMIDYFDCPLEKRKHRPQLNIVSTLQNDCKRLEAFTLQSKEDLQYLKSIAAERNVWKNLVEQICEK